MKTHEENIKIYLEKGGDKKLASKFKLATLQNRAKISYLLSRLSLSYISKSTNSDITEVDKSKDLSSKPKFLGFISQYPNELHLAYKNCYNAWLDVCSLKIKLNEVSPLNQKEAYNVQLAIFISISKLDKYKKLLDYWNENKRILPTESKKDFSKFTPLELDKYRRNLVSLISRRKETIVKKERELPIVEASNYQKKYSSLQIKKEQLEELILDHTKIVEILTSISN